MFTNHADNGDHYYGDIVNEDYFSFTWVYFLCLLDIERILTIMPTMTAGARCYSQLLFLRPGNKSFPRQ